MSHHRLICFPVAALAAWSAIAVASAQTIPANKTASETVPQSGEEVSRAAATLNDVTLPAGFRIDLFARVPGARAMAVADDGRKLFVGTSGAQVYMLDLQGPGGPVSSVKTFAPSISKKMAHGVCFGPDKTLYLAEQNRILAFPDAAAHAESPDLAARTVVAEGKLIPPFLQSEYHTMRVCRVGPDGALYVTIGQPANVPTPQRWQLFLTNGLGTIQRMKTDGSARTVYAGGIRNSVGLDFDPRGGKLWFTDNQVDFMGDDIPPGEINRVDRAGQTFGFPWFGGGHVRTPQWMTSTPPKDSVFPQVEMQAHAADLGMIFYRGKLFPARFRGGIFSAQHGSWNRSKPVGPQVMFTPVASDGAAGRPEVFAAGWRAADGTYRGRPVDVAELKDGSIVVSDDTAGAIYRVSVVRSPVAPSRGAPTSESIVGVQHGSAQSP